MPSLTPGAEDNAGTEVDRAEHQADGTVVGGGGCKLFVGCLPYSKTEADLEPVFGQFGPLVEVTILRDPTGGSKGAGFVTYQDEASAMTAMAFLQGHVLDGATRGMNLSLATSTGGPKNQGSQSPMQAVWHLSQQVAWQPVQASASGSQACLPGSKVFVGQLPYSRTEADLFQLFSCVGPVVEVVLLKDKKTQERKGAAFVRYQTPEHAAAACNALNGFVFSGSTRPITVSIAFSSGGEAVSSMGELVGGCGGGACGQKRQAWQLEQQQVQDQSLNQVIEHPEAVEYTGSTGSMQGARASTAAVVPSEPGAKLFVGQLPFSRNEEDLRQLFSQYGPVVEVLLHRDAQGQKKGGAFVRFQSAESATLALDLDGYLFQGSTRPIIVSVASEGFWKKRRVD